MFPLSTPFLLTKPGERMIMYLLSPGLVNRKGAERGNIDISSTQIHDHFLSPGLVNRKGVERGNIDISSTQIHDHYSLLAWSIEKVQKEETLISLEHIYMTILSPGLDNRKRCRKRKH